MGRAQNGMSQLAHLSIFHSQPAGRRMNDTDRHRDDHRHLMSEI